MNATLKTSKVRENQKKPRKREIHTCRERYLKENIIAYIGNKRRLLPFLEYTFLGLIEKDKNMKTALDLFAGSGSVSRLLKTLGLQVCSNDWEYYSYILNYAHLSINPTEISSMFLHFGGVSNVLDMLNNMPAVASEHRYISKYYAPKDDNNPDIINERMFYSQANAIRIDTIRHSVEIMYQNNAINKKEYFYLLAALLYEAATHANTSGIFKAFHAGFGGKKGDALNRILAPITMRELPLYESIKGSVSMQDAAKFSKQNRNKQFDIVYLDPPYNQHQYGSNYHLLNTIALWDKPYVNENIYIEGKKTNKSAIRADWVKTKSDYCYKHSALLALENLLQDVQSRYFVMSYSTDGVINYELLLSTLNKFGSLSIVSSDYTRYRGAKRSLVNIKKNIEYLFILDTKKKANKIDYSKDYYIEQIRLLLNNPFDVDRDAITFIYEDIAIEIELKYQTHAIDIQNICTRLRGCSIECIRAFELFINKHTKRDNISALLLYLTHFENAVLIKDKKYINHFGSLVLSCYTSISVKKSLETLPKITERILFILSFYEENSEKPSIVSRLQNLLRIESNITS